MRLIFDAAIPLLSEGGYRLRDNLTRAAARNAPPGSELVVLVNHSDDPIEAAGPMRYVRVDNSSRRWLPRWRWLHRRLPEVLRDLQADAVYSFSGVLSRQMKAVTGVITTVNNMLPFYLDVMWECRGITPRIWLTNQLLRRHYVSAVRLADAVVLHSQHALNSLTPYVRELPDKTIVRLTGVPQHVNVLPEQLEHPYHGSRYFCCFSVIRPYKNNIRLIEGYDLAAQQEPALPDLVFVGLPQYPRYAQMMRDRIAALNMQHKIKFLGAIEKADIPCWLYHADVNYFPSLVETNSVVQSEIIGIGAAQACSGIPPMSEVAGGAADLFDPRSIEDIGRSFVRLYRDDERRGELRRLSRQRATELSWDECGSAIWQAAAMAYDAHCRRSGRPLPAQPRRAA